MALVDARIFRRIVPFWKHLSKRYLGGKVPRPVELSPSPPGAGTDPAHISRPVLEAELKTLIRRRVSLAIFGPPRQGKTTLLQSCIGDARAIYIDCRPGFKRAQIYRLILSSVGYAITVQKKRKAKASYKLSLGIAKSGLSGDIADEDESEVKQINVDLKNASEVAHLVSKLDNLPIVVLNGFHMLNRQTKESLLFDIAFLLERTKMCFIIVGAWYNDYYLEEIQPAIADKLQYIRLPYWSDDELRAAYRAWSDRQLVASDNPAVVDEMLTMSSGDISLFATLALRMPPIAAVGFTSAAERIVVGRSSRPIETSLVQLRRSRELAISYDTVSITFSLVPNSQFTPIAGLPENQYQRVAINPETARPYQSDRSVELDASGRPKYLERATARIVSNDEMIDEFVLRKLYAGVLDGKDRFSIADLAEQYRSEQIPDAIFVDMNKLEKIFFRFTDAQRRRLISPPLIAIDQQSGVLSVGDRRFFLVLRTVTVDDFDDLMDRTAPTRQPSPRRSAEVSIELSDTDKAKFLAEQVKLAENRLVSGASQTPDAAREAPDGDASRRAADPLDEYDDSDWEEESDEEGTGEDGSDDDGHDDDGSDQDESDAVGSDDETRNCAGSGDTIPATPSAPSSHGCG